MPGSDNRRPAESNTDPRPQSLDVPCGSRVIYKGREITVKDGLINGNDVEVVRHGPERPNVKDKKAMAKAGMIVAGPDKEETERKVEDVREAAPSACTEDKNTSRKFVVAGPDEEDIPSTKQKVGGGAKGKAQDVGDDGNAHEQRTESIGLAAGEQRDTRIDSGAGTEVIDVQD